MRLEAFLVGNRAEIIERCRAKVAQRRAPRATDAELEHGIPLFLDQLVETLQLHLQCNPDVERRATTHGGQRMTEGFTVAQVVHDYGDVCQSVTDLAIAQHAPISTEDFRVLNRCLDDAISDAVTEFARVRDLSMASAGNERLGILAHEVRNLLNSAMLTFDILKSGRVGMTGSTGAVLGRSLNRLNALVDRSLAEVRIEAGVVRREPIEVRRLLEEIEITAVLDAKAKGVVLAIDHPADAGVKVEGDPQILSAVIVNLVQNAVKFTRRGGHVGLSTRVDDAHVHIDISDECGGLPAGVAEKLFESFAQGGEDRTGVGLGLVVARRGAEAHGGQIQVRDVPGTGCVFTVALPRAA